MNGLFYIWIFLSPYDSTRKKNLITWASWANTGHNLFVNNFNLTFSCGTCARRLDCETYQNKHFISPIRASLSKRITVIIYEKGYWVHLSEDLTAGRFLITKFEEVTLYVVGNNRGLWLKDVTLQQFLDVL